MALRELPSFTTNNANAAEAENCLSTADSCVCVRVRVHVLWYHKMASQPLIVVCVCVCALVSQNEIYGKSRKENFARTLAKNNLKNVNLKPV